MAPCNIKTNNFRNMILEKDLLPQGPPKSHPTSGAYTSPCILHNCCNSFWTLCVSTLPDQHPLSKTVDHEIPIHINHQVPLWPRYGQSMVEHSLPPSSRLIILQDLCIQSEVVVPRSIYPKKMTKLCCLRINASYEIDPCRWVWPHEVT